MRVPSETVGDSRFEMHIYVMYRIMRGSIFKIFCFGVGLDKTLTVTLAPARSCMLLTLANLIAYSQFLAFGITPSRS